MARTRMITRTVTTVDFKVLVVNTETLKGEYITVSIPSGDTLSEKVLDAQIKAHVPEGLLFAQVVDSVKHEKLYGMTEELFLKYAEELPER